jgi:sugar lactone lactonase YvrE
MTPSRAFATVLVASLPVLGACDDASTNPSSSPGGSAGVGGQGTGGASAGDTASGGMTTGGVSGSSGGTPAGGGATSGGAGGTGETAGNAGSAAVGGAAGAGNAAGIGGEPTQGGAAGSSTDGGAAGSAGVPVAGAAGDAGRGGVSGNSGAAGAAGVGGSAGSNAASCPAGPFPAPTVISTKDVCGDFDLRYSWNEGPAWVDSEQAFFFTNFVAGSASGGDIIKYTPDGQCERFIPDVGCNGLAPSKDGGLLAACQQTRSVVRFDLSTKQPTTIASTYMGTQLDTPNDLVEHSNGSVYFTNPTNELAGRPVGVGAAAFRIDPNGALSMIGQGNCNGIALSPDETRLYVIQLGMWDLDALGVPSNRQSLFTSGDGIAVDCAGNVYANGTIYDAAGEQLGSWGNGTNLAFGGADGTTVLVVGRGTALRQLSVNVPGPP